MSIVIYAGGLWMGVGLCGILLAALGRAATQRPNEPRRPRRGAPGSTTRPAALVPACC